MPNIGPMELLIVAVIALIVLGPKRLPDAGKSLGKGLREFKGAISGRDDDDDDDEREAREPAAIQPVEPAKPERREAEPVA
jgi:sec-independent protein translocase protein TatA